MARRDALVSIIDFHGHMCPGLAMGIRAAEIALGETGPHSIDEEVVAIVETDMCGVDAIQFMTGCTFGKGNLVHRDHGKNVYTFVRRSDGRAIRVSTRSAVWRPDGIESDLFTKVREGRADLEERQQLAKRRGERSDWIMAAPVGDLYEVTEVEVEAPRAARILASVDCASCGEPTMETRIRRLEGRDLCCPCFDQDMAGGPDTVVLVAGKDAPGRRYACDPQP